MNFFCKLLPPRPTFAHDLTPDEAELMKAHTLYWHEWLQRGHVIAFGLVDDPRGAFGIGVVTFDSEADARSFTDGDPTIQSGQGFTYEVHPMPFGVARG